MLISFVKNRIFLTVVSRGFSYLSRFNLGLVFLARHLYGVSWARVFEIIFLRIRYRPQNWRNLEDARL